MPNPGKDYLEGESSFEPSRKHLSNLVDRSFFVMQLLMALS